MRTSVAQVRGFLASELPHGNATIEALADRLRMNVRTLQRHLEATGVSFVALLDEARRQLATDLLCDPNRTLLDVALEVGFKDTSSLYRACSRWTGEGPAALRIREPSVE